jgi:hypothetical protein
MHGTQKDDAGKFLNGAIRNAKAASVRILFDYNLDENKDLEQAKEEILEWMRLGFDGYRLVYKENPPDGFEEMLAVLLKETIPLNAYAAIAIPDNGTRESLALEALVEEYRLYHLVPLDPGDRLNEHTLKKRPWMLLRPQKYTGDEKGANDLIGDLDYVMNSAVSVVDMDSGFFLQGENMRFSNIKDFKAYFIDLFRKRIEKRKEDPAFRFDGGRISALRLPVEKLPDFGEGRDSLRDLLLDVLINFGSPAEKGEAERAKAVAKTTESLRAIINRMPQGIVYDILQNYSEEMANAGSSLSEQERIAAEAAGFIRGLLEKDTGRLSTRPIRFYFWQHADMYRSMLVDSQILIRANAAGPADVSGGEAAYLRFYDALVKIDGNYETSDKDIVKAVGRQTAVDKSAIDAAKNIKVRQNIRNLVSTFEKNHLDGASADTVENDILVLIGDLYLLQRRLPPATRALAMAELMKILAEYAKKTFESDPKSIEKSSQDMLLKTIGYRHIESAA